MAAETGTVNFPQCSERHVDMREFEEGSGCGYDNIYYIHVFKYQGTNEKIVVK